MIIKHKIVSRNINTWTQARISNTRHNAGAVIPDPYRSQLHPVFNTFRRNTNRLLLVLHRAIHGVRKQVPKGHNDDDDRA